ncbi:HEPN domain-containing protein [Streptomyces sp. NBC_01262]|uniref:HEPN domain-containing protein n=1 Tax=Streptomyces sp. NBC_01262 TaxID=2903803 RepID=UPI002E334B99|nr:HEPN domain-containing protein [Streptomyces sp. NBC_01262]
MNPVQRLYEDHRDALEYLRDRQQVSHHATLQMTLPKVLLLAAASEFEERVSEALRDHVRENTRDLKIVELVDQKAIRRHYHTLFDWDTRTAAKFWALFGSEFKAEMKNYCQHDFLLAIQIGAFMEIGSLRNQMVHNNYASFVLEKTLDEVYGLYCDGDSFVQRLPELLRLKFD